MEQLRGTVDLNGRLVAAARAQVSAFDRGFQYGDALFETLRAYSGRPFALERHLKRLERSSRLLGITLPQVDWERRIATLLRRNRLQRADARVRITVTRGTGPPDLAPSSELRPTVLITATRIDAAVARLQRYGGAAVLLPFTRYGFLAEHKTVNYLPAVLARPLMARHRSVEGLYVDRDRQVTEGTASNFFVVLGGSLITAPAKGILQGVTRNDIIALAKGAGIAVRERAVPVRSLQRAEEAFVTSAVVEILPMTRIGEARVGSGRVGPITRRLQRLYRELVRRELGR